MTQWLCTTYLPSASAVYSQHVEFQNLALIRWRDDEGHTQRFYLMDDISYKWRIIGELVGLTHSKLENLAEEHRDKAERCCRSVLGYWLDNPHPRYPTTWQGLIELLEDSQLSEIASQLRTALPKADLWNWLHLHVKAITFLFTAVLSLLFEIVITSVLANNFWTTWHKVCCAKFYTNMFTNFSHTV